MEVPLKKVVGFKFGIASPEEIRSQSVTEVIKIEAFEGGKPIDTSAYDLRLGSISSKEECKSCKLNGNTCPGHFGHIELAKPIYNVMFIDAIHKVLECICFRCGSLLLSPKISKEAILKIKLSRRMRAISEQAKKNSTCYKCGNKQPQFKKKETYKIYFNFKGTAATTEAAAGANNGEAAAGGIELTAEYALQLFKKLSDEEIELLGMDPRYARPSWMIFEALPVSPPSMRPMVRTEEYNRREDDIFSFLISIIRHNTSLRKKIDDLHAAEVENPNAVKALQEYINMISYIVSAMMNDKVKKAQGRLTYFATKKPLKSILSRLSGKKGRIRLNILGKRVDYSARTVISPDVRLDIDELGMPLMVARTLTFPEVVTEDNIESMYVKVRNGDHIYPGALSVIHTGMHGSPTKILRYMTKEDVNNIVLAPGDIVNRHIIDGDWVLFNRMPSLHKLSMMAFKVVVMPGENRTFRFNPCNCKPFNADFDG